MTPRSWISTGWIRGCAARFGHEGCLDRLVAAGAKLDLQDTNELTAVMCAADKGSEACLSRLVAVGAKFDLRDTEGDTAVMYAADKGHVGCVALLEAAGCRSMKATHPWTESGHSTALAFRSRDGKAAEAIASPDH